MRISSAVNAVSGINHWSITGYSAGNTQISDGGGDMYDNGNQITTGDGSQVVYTDDCAEGSAGSQSYHMDIVADGITTLTMDSMTSDRLQIDGNLGADGSGSRTNRVYHYNGYRAFWRQTHSAGDPSVTHIWITNAANPQHEDSNANTNSDLDYISGVQGADVIYLHWGETSGAEVSEAQFQAVVQAAVDSLTPAAGKWTITRTHSKWGGSREDVVCGESTDELSIEARPSISCAEKHNGAAAWVVVNQQGKELTWGFYCDNQGNTEIVGTPTFAVDDTCLNSHNTIDDGY